MKNFYENNYSEAGRLERNPLEFIRSKEIITRFLVRPSMKIADIGGAAGVYRPYIDLYILKLFNIILSYSQGWVLDIDVKLFGRADCHFS